jgi:membrane-associated protease RseP (regulator of RpoE activity)
VLGAHYDHLGTVRDETYHGADDNGSGTALVVGLARAFAEAGGAPRTLVFVLFGAEEIGLVGSGHYVRRAAIPVARTAAMLNFDMVGRLGDGRLTIGGVDSGHGLRAAVEGATRAAALPATLRGLPWAPSDHSRFYSAGAPVLFFHTGIHPDYHRPTDTADRIDAAGMARIATVAADVTSRLAAGGRPAWVAHTPRRPGRERGAAPVVLGVAADGRHESDGVRLAQVLPGSAADRAGLREGDVLVRVGGTVMNGFDDLRSTLRGRRPGDSLPILYLRDGEDHETIATVDARS